MNSPCVVRSRYTCGPCCMLLVVSRGQATNFFAGVIACILRGAFTASDNARAKEVWPRELAQRQSARGVHALTHVHKHMHAYSVSKEDTY